MGSRRWPRRFLLAAPEDRSEAESGPVAPDVSAEIPGTLLTTVGLEPAPLGTPARFAVGAPLPSITSVVREGNGYHLEPLANEPSYAWRLSATGLVRIDAMIDPTTDGLAPVRLFRLDADPIEARVTPVNDPLTGLHVTLDAAGLGTSLWLAQWTAWSGTALARFVPGREATAITLVPGSPEAAARARDPELGRSTAMDERVAITAYQHAALVAYTASLAEGRSMVRLATTLADSDRCRGRAGRRARHRRARAVAGVLSARAWRSRAGDRRCVRVARASDRCRGRDGSVPRGGAAGFRVRRTGEAVRCDANGLVAYGRDHARSSPVMVRSQSTDVRSQRCATDAGAHDHAHVHDAHACRTRGRARRVARGVRPRGRHPRVGARGRARRVHRTQVGRCLSLGRRWRVLFDAAAHMHGYAVDGLDLCVEGESLLVAIAAPDGLHILRSDDAGANWH